MKPKIYKKFDVLLSKKEIEHAMLALRLRIDELSGELKIKQTPRREKEINHALDYCTNAFHVLAGALREEPQRVLIFQ